jgi:hypothetical protein
MNVYFIVSGHIQLRCKSEVEYRCEYRNTSILWIDFHHRLHNCIHMHAMKSMYSTSVFMAGSVLVLLLSLMSNTESFLFAPTMSAKFRSLTSILGKNSQKVDDAMLDKILEVAIDASKKAGDIIIGNYGGAEITKTKANSRDLLTLIDPLCEMVSILLLKTD